MEQVTCEGCEYYEEVHGRLAKARCRRTGTAFLYVATDKDSAVLDPAVHTCREAKRVPALEVTHEGYTARQVGISVWVSRYGEPVGHMTLRTPCETEAQLLEVLLAHINFMKERGITVNG